MLRGGLNLTDAQKLVEMADKVLDHQVARDKVKAEQEQVSHVEGIVARYLETQLASSASGDGAPKSKIEQLIEDYIVKQLEKHTVGDDDGFCYLLLFDSSCHEELSSALGAHPTWKQVVLAGKDFPLSAKTVVAEKTGEEKWHVAEHVDGRAPHALLRIVETFGPFLMHRVGMPYKGYGARAIIAGTAPWYEISQFSTVLRESSGMSFGVKANRENIRKKFDTLGAEAPFSVSERFPANGLFLFKGAGDWHGKFTRLYESLDTSAESAVQAASTARDTRAAPSSYDDAFHSFYKNLEAMNTQLLNGDGVYGRSEFESAFGLTWEVTTLTDLRPALAGVFQVGEIRFNTNNLGQLDWPGLAGTAVLGAAASDVRVASGSRIVLFSDNRTSGHRARTVMMLQADGTLGGFIHDVVGTTD